MGLTLSHHLAVRNFTKEKKIRDWRKEGEILHITQVRGEALKKVKMTLKKKNPHLGNNSDILSSTRKPI